MQEILSKNKSESLDFSKLITEAKISAEKLKLIAQDNYTNVFLAISLLFSISILILSIISLYYFALSLIRADLYFFEMPSSVLFSIGILGVFFGLSGTWYLLSRLTAIRIRRRIALRLAEEIEQELSD